MIEFNLCVKMNLIWHVTTAYNAVFNDRPIKCIELLKCHQIVTSLIPINAVLNKNCMLPNCCLLRLTLITLHFLKSPMLKLQSTDLVSTKEGILVDTWLGGQHSDFFFC